MPGGKQIEIWGKILTKKQKNQDSASFIIAYAKPLDFKLKDAPIFIKESNKELGNYRLSTFKVLSTSSLELVIEPFEVPIFSVKSLPTYRGRPLCPQCGCEVMDLSNHMSRLHTASTVRPPNRSTRNIKTKSRANRNYLSFHNQNAGDLIKCPKCNAPLRPSNLNKHLRKVHHHSE
jgi:hypothetical protein